ncbi:MAG: hypothetical protein KDC24_10600 [Saprospiraceae bacterium]|nr:hypothetical protein [Saprospiraceae bacterium]
MQTLIFVYNANSGKWNGYMDMMHKIFSPKTYPCHLCDITYGIFTIRESWQSFIEKLEVPLRFLHKDEWEAEFDLKDELPAIFKQDEKGVEVWIDRPTMEQLDLEGLKALILKKLEVESKQ